LTIGCRDATSCSAHIAANRGDSASSSPTSAPIERSPGYLAYAARRSARELAGTPVKVNAANPGYCATDLNGRSGFRAAAEGASVSVHLATLPADGPTGTLWGYRWSAADPGQYGDLPW